MGEGSSLSKGNLECQGLKARIVLSSSNSKKASVPGAGDAEGRGVTWERR